MAKIDLTGKTIADILVEHETNPSFDGRGFPRRRWTCKCLLCNNEFDVLQQNLLNGNTKSCGCAKSKPLIGQRFGSLLVIGEDFSKIDSKGHRIKRWICQCDCGAIILVVTQKLKSGRTQSCGCAGSRGERDISKILKLYNIRWEPQYMFEGLNGIGGDPLRFDFGILDSENKLQYLIEYQGIQHRQTMGPNGFGKQQLLYTDPQKKDFCNKNKIKLYEIWFDQNIEKELKDILHGNAVPVAG